MGKDIIINGIDVSECRFYESKAQKMTCHEETITKPCESTPICYYKLLQKSYIEIQRLQEENERLIKINNDFAENHKTIGQDLYKECVSLRSELTVQKEVAKAFCKGLEQTEKLLDKYKQALEEINILAKNYCNACDEFKAKTYKNKNDCFYCNYGFIKRKINEVLNDRD